VTRLDHRPAASRARLLQSGLNFRDQSVVVECRVHVAGKAGLARPWYHHSLPPSETRLISSSLQPTIMAWSLWSRSHGWCCGCGNRLVRSIPTRLSMTDLVVVLRALEWLPLTRATNVDWTAGRVGDDCGFASFFSPHGWTSGHSEAMCPRVQQPRPPPPGRTVGASGRKQPDPGAVETKEDHMATTTKKPHPNSRSGKAQAASPTAAISRRRRRSRPRPTAHRHVAPQGQRVTCGDHGPLGPEEHSSRTLHTATIAKDRAAGEVAGPSH